MGDQFLTATYSCGANIAEGYLRHHYLEKIKFYYNARASLTEAGRYWLELLRERGKIDNGDYQEYAKVYKNISIKLQNFITSTYKAKDKQ